VMPDSRPTPSEEPPAYEVALEHEEAERAGEGGAFLAHQRTHERDSIDELSIDLELPGGEDRQGTELHQEMEYFEIAEPEAGTSSGNVYTRASEASKRFARKINSTLIHPVKMLVDPVAKLWHKVNGRIDAGLSKLGNPLMFKRLIYVIVVAIITFISISIGILPTDSGMGTGPFSGHFHDHRQIRTYLQDAISADSIRDHVEYLSSMSHMAGTSGDFTLAKHVEGLFESYGLRTVEFNEEQVFLSAPNTTEDAMQLRLLGDDDQQPLFDARLWEGEVYEHPTDAQAQPRPFHALSAPGNGTGHVVYANYGTKDDFAYLKAQGVELAGAVVFMKYGKMTLGLKVHLAELEGAVGVVAFSEKATNAKSWPDGPDYPEDAVQRADVAMTAICPGDILTPGWSSSSSSSVIDYSAAHNVPKIPSIPVSWNNVKPFLVALKGHGIKVDGEWANNGMPDLEEWWTGDANSPKAFIKNEPILKDRHSIWNVLGIIDGMEQYDKAIIIGAQRDSFCYGAVEPASGTAVLLELVRVFSLLNRQLGWTPLRSVYFASWDATEQNIAGSTEWVEYHVEQLRRDGLIYIDLDAAVSGTDIQVSGHPVFDGVIQNVLEHVSDPIKNSSSLADSWGDSHVSAFKDYGDYLPFFCHAGIASIRVRFQDNETDGLFPRHSCFDTIDWIKQNADPEFRYHKALAEVIAFLVLKYSDEPVIPFNIAAYGDALHRYVKDLERYAKSMPGFNDGLLNFGLLVLAADRMIQDSVVFSEWMKDWTVTVSDGEPPMVSGHRWNWNSRMTNLDKNILERNGIPHRNWYKHVVFGPQLWHPTTGDYEWSTFPGVRDAIEEGDWVQAQAQINRAASLIGFACDKFVE
jgi:N-acetylated-alpha-linked acidic dipeptidase